MRVRAVFPETAGSKLYGTIGYGKLNRRGFDESMTRYYHGDEFEIERFEQFSDVKAKNARNGHVGWMEFVDPEDEKRYREWVKAGKPASEPLVAADDRRGPGRPKKQAV